MELELSLIDADLFLRLRCRPEQIAVDDNLSGPQLEMLLQSRKRKVSCNCKEVVEFLVR